MYDSFSSDKSLSHKLQMGKFEETPSYTWISMKQGITHYMKNSQGAELS